MHRCTILVILLLILYYYWPALVDVWSSIQSKIPIMSPADKSAIESFTMSRKNMNAARVVTYHFTTWCGYCKLMRPVWDDVVKASKGTNIIFKETDEDVAKTAGIRGVPLIRMVTEDGHMVDYSGRADFSQLLAWVTALPAPR